MAYVLGSNSLAACTSSLALCLTLSVSLSLSHSLCLTLSLSHSHCLTLTVSLSLSHSQCLTLNVSLSLSHCLTVNVSDDAAEASYRTEHRGQAWHRSRSPSVATMVRTVLYCTAHQGHTHTFIHIFSFGTTTTLLCGIGHSKPTSSDDVYLFLCAARAYSSSRCSSGAGLTCRWRSSTTPSATCCLRCCNCRNCCIYVCIYCSCIA